MTLFIRNVRILGGEKEYPDPMDVFVTNGIISAIGNFSNKRADIVLDGQGAYLSPGFIDVNTDSDHYLTLFDHRSQEDFLKQGVTTIIGGMCGASLAPLTYGTLESLQKWGDPSRINVNWHTMAEFLSILEARPLAVNFGTLVGHATVRRALVGEALRELTKNEIGVFKRTLEESMASGAFGLSSGLSYVHARNATYTELATLAKTVAAHGGIYATHIRDNGEQIMASVEETIRLAKESGVKTVISHFMPLTAHGEEYEKARARLDELSAAITLRYDMYPFAESLVPIYTFLPVWAQNGGVEVMLANVNDDWLASRIAKDMKNLLEDRFRIAQASGNDFLIGKSLREVREMYGLTTPQEALLKLMRTMKMKGSILYENIDIDRVREALKAPRSLVASNAASFGKMDMLKLLKSSRTTSTFMTFITMAEEGLMPIQDAIRKITREPAELYGLKGRGVLKEGAIADLTCFKGGEVKYTIVNGTLTESQGEFQNKYSGKVLRHAYH